MTASMAEEMRLPGRNRFIVLLLVVMAMFPCVSLAQLGSKDQPTFIRHFWSTSDKDHYKLSKDGELAELILDEKAGKFSSLWSDFMFPVYLPDGQSTSYVIGR